MGLMRIDRALLSRAAALDPPELRSIDAIHLASALTLDAALTAFVTYDRRLEAAAVRAGLSVEAPA
jgi:predicted nucleic acid-binding protein